MYEIKRFNRGKKMRQERSHIKRHTYSKLETIDLKIKFSQKEIKRKLKQRHHEINPYSSSQQDIITILALKFKFGDEKHTLLKEKKYFQKK